MERRARQIVELVGMVAPYGIAAQVGRVPYLTAFHPGAFDAAIAGGEVELRVNHRASPLVANQASGTLTFTDTSAGLFFAATIPNYWADTLQQLDLSGLLAGMSVGLSTTARDGWHFIGPAEDVVLHTQANLREVSLVLRGHQPAFRNTYAFTRETL